MSREQVPVVEGTSRVAAIRSTVVFAGVRLTRVRAFVVVDVPRHVSLHALGRACFVAGTRFPAWEKLVA